MTWLSENARDGSTELERAFGLIPDAHARFRELYAALDDARAFPPEALALCRTRIARLLGAPDDNPFGGIDFVVVAPEKARALPKYATSPLFTDAERACIAYAEQYVLDPHGFADSDFERLHESFSPPELATLTLAVAVYDALARFRLALEIGASAEASA